MVTDVVLYILYIEQNINLLCDLFVSGCVFLFQDLISLDQDVYSYFKMSSICIDICILYFKILYINILDVFVQMINASKAIDRVRYCKLLTNF